MLDDEGAASLFSASPEPRGGRSRRADGGAAAAGDGAGGRGAGGGPGGSSWSLGRPWGAAAGRRVGGGAAGGGGGAHGGGDGRRPGPRGPAANPAVSMESLTAWTTAASSSIRLMGDAIRTRVPGGGGAKAVGGGAAAVPANDLGSDGWMGGLRPPSAVPPSALPRVVLLNAREANRRAGFPRNYVSTTKYTWLSAAPTFLFEQRTRFSNAYFIVVGILYLFDSISPVFTAGRYASLYSVGIVVAIAAVREALEELRRYKEDRWVNRDAARVLGVGDCTWADMRWRHGAGAQGQAFPL